MKTKQSMTIYFVIAFAFLFLAIGTAAAELGTETQITTSVSYQESPAISGDRIVWMDNLNGNSDIYMYDISTKVETQITTNGSNQDVPAISGDRIVWMDYRNGNSDIYMYDISTKEETQITTNGSDQDIPAISGDRIVWSDYRNGNWDIYMYDISTKVETQITTNGNYQWLPAISGDRIVWYDNRNGNWDIYMYDISTDQETQITTSISRQYAPAISGDRIVWYDNRNGNWDIYMYDISTDQETQITTNVSDQGAPAISGDRIVWQDDRNGNSDIYMYDISTKEETQITTSVYGQYAADISGDRIVWQDDRNGNSDIYMFTLGMEDLVDEGSIDIEKYVWSGTGWEDADSAPGPSLSSDPVRFKIEVNNTGNVTLTGVNVIDDKYGPVVLSTTTLDPGASTAAEYNMPRSSGQQINAATASGYYNDTEYTDTDSAYYDGTSVNVHTAINDNNLRESSACSVLGTTTYIDVGKSKSRARDVMLFDLSMYDKNDTISKATLSLFWYYPAGQTRTSDTVVEIYRPGKWNPKYVTWYYYDYRKAWKPVGGAWFDANGVAQGTTPYASVTFPAGTVPDNQYHDFDVTQLVQEYVSGKYLNTGFFLKAQTESGNYIAFYSSDWSDANKRPKLTVEL